MPEAVGAGAQRSDARIEDVCLLGNAGSRLQTVRVTLLTQSGIVLSEFLQPR